MTAPERLKSLLSKEEIKTLRKNINEGTPLWKHWGKFVQSYLRKGNSVVTVRNCRDALRFIIKNAGMYTIEECNNHLVFEEALAQLMDERGFLAITFNTYVKNINTFFGWLEYQEYISENKLKKIQKYRERSHRKPLVLSEDQVMKVRNAVRYELKYHSRLLRARDILFIDLVTLTGARPVELLKIGVGDREIEGEKSVLTIHGGKQNTEDRYYILPDYVNDSWGNYINLRKKHNRHEPELFISHRKNIPLGERGMRGLFRKISEKVQFRVIAYSIRRQVATRLHHNNLSIRKIGDYLGQKKELTTLRYIERNGMRTKEGVEIMTRDE